MIDFPSPATLATLLSNVTETMFGLKFEPSATASQVEPPGWKTAVMSVDGVPAFLVSLAADPSGCQTLGSAMFSCPRESLDAMMVDDSLRELLNMTAGLIKREMSLDHALGLPRIIESSAPPEHGTRDDFSGVTLKATNAEIILSISKCNASTKHPA